MSAVIAISKGPMCSRDPIVGRIGAFRHDHLLNARIGARAYPAIADNVHDEAVTVRHTLDLVLDRARIGIDENL